MTPESMLLPEIAALLRLSPVPALMDMQGRSAAMHSIDDINLMDADGGCMAARLYVPLERLHPLPLVVYFHGGGWQRGDLTLYDQPCRAIADAGGCAVLSVAYRLAPLHRFPAALLDCHAATLQAAAHAAQWGCDARRLVVAGDSAGGNLAAATCLLARERGTPAIAHQLLIYPALDATMGSASSTEFAHAPFLDRAGTQASWAAYAGPLADLRNPLLSPLHLDDFSGLPGATLITAEVDPVRDDAARYVQKLRDAGVPATLDCLPGIPHMALHMSGISAACRQITTLAGRALRERFSTGMR